MSRVLLVPDLPLERWPSMDALLDLLSRKRVLRRRRALILAAYSLAACTSVSTYEEKYA